MSIPVDPIPTEVEKRLASLEAQVAALTRVVEALNAIAVGAEPAQGRSHHEEMTAAVVAVRDAKHAPR